MLPKSSLHTLYLTIVQRHLNYGLHIWGSSNYIGKILISQNKSLRIINNKTYNSHTEPLFKSSEILSANDQYKFIVQMFMYQHKHDTLPKSFNSLVYFTHINISPLHGNLILQIILVPELNLHHYYLYIYVP